MDKTPITLYRQGNSNSPRMDNVRPDKDIACYDQDGQVWIRTTLADGKSPGGISTFANPGYGKNWWQLEAGTEIPEQIELVNDYDHHWLWKPIKNMPLEDYKAALQKIGTYFSKVNE
ncbi:hypothetical protein H6G54_26295 [Anabaena cylindrica FACHB-243]|uniref:Tse2 ADP-ribosyltransferase toxin domain-containing protein n=1 Tax=Anabaena cylindrica (strain ATCC 27899 / PCC 7122) TaxID=272123 RepID=K9ZFD1_ANACC|nr:MULTISPECIES: hypothetical protein [Anabaena]AFZ57454.1 hypothetical protein Anacy_1969 [Anabaena cylindrica PCC 7122]MBD2421135.1 hypothetical protein [Anabaena cylindrica FACHB-243]MBY5281158.1 hypothetical protein [Anabaena sp. CCAP 1446/1C]MBY5308568.1 hypothetical protein [Anabaena sp. CCAP 1446/1C]MCM2405890.1 hypothetical protein [Anabaena sp. CCAP 1446/1C]